MRQVHGRWTLMALFAYSASAAAQVVEIQASLTVSVLSACNVTGLTASDSHGGFTTTGTVGALGNLTINETVGLTVSQSGGSQTIAINPATTTTGILAQVDTGATPDVWCWFIKLMFAYTCPNEQTCIATSIINATRGTGAPLTVQVLAIDTTNPGATIPATVTLGTLCSAFSGGGVFAASTAPFSGANAPNTLYTPNTAGGGTGVELQFDNSCTAAASTDNGTVRRNYILAVPNLSATDTSSFDLTFRARVSPSTI